MVSYNNKRQMTLEIVFLKNESQTMITFVSKGQSQSIGIFTQLTMKYFYVNSSVNVNFYVNFS